MTNEENLSRLKDIKARTMVSDTASTKEEGGGEPKSYTPEKLETEQKPQAGGGTFQPPQITQTQPPTESLKTVPPGDAKIDAQPKKMGNKKLFVVLLVIILLVGIGAAVYFLFLTPPEEEVTSLEPEMAPITEEAETTVDVPTILVEESVTEGEEAVIEEGAEEAPERVIPASAHISLLSLPADSTANIQLSSLDLSTLYTSLGFSPTEVPLLREVVLIDSNDNLIVFNEIAELLAPTVFAPEILDAFENDATFFTYTDRAGTWFGVIAQLTSDANKGDTMLGVAMLENTMSEVQNFFLTNPGSAGTWKEGGVGNVTNRYVVFEKDGAALNYGWGEDVLLITTSYSAFKEVASRL